MLNSYEYDLLIKYRSPQSSPKTDVDNQRFQTFIDRKYVTINSVNHDLRPKDWMLTAAGCDALLEFEERRYNKAKQERQQRFENKISVLNLFVPLITFVLGLIVENRFEIVSFFISLFH